MPGLLFDTLERVTEGKRVKEEDFDMALAKRAKEFAEKYEIKYDSNHVVVEDDAMADRLFEAGLAFAVETGLWVLDTRRVVKFSEAEIWRKLENFHTNLVLGWGKDQVMLLPRKPESTTPALVIGGGAGSAMSEGDLYVKHIMDFVLEPTVDLINQGNPELMEGRVVHSNSPLEIHGAIQEIAWVREAIRRAGRPGIPMFTGPGCASVAAAAIAGIDSERGVRKGDFLYTAVLTELKTDYDRLNRAVACLENGVHIITLLAPMIGGWAGGPAGAAIAGTASTIMAAVAYDATIVVNHPVHMNLKCGATTHRETLWLESMIGQAISRNTVFPIGQNIFLSHRAGTVNALYECAANAIVAVTSGQHSGPGPSGVIGGEDVDMITAIEQRIVGEVSRGVTGMPRKEANELVKYCLDKYEASIFDPPMGKKFQELYDVKKLKPTEEWLGTFEEVKADLKRAGVPFLY